MKKRVITIDNGGSELRYISNTDNRDVHVVDNNISIIDPLDFRIKESVGDLDIVKVVSAPDTELQKMFATENGYYMYSGVGVGFNSQTKKSDSTAWYQKCIIAIAKDAMGALLREEENNSGKKIDNEYEYVLVPLIPLYEHSGSTDFITKLKNRLAGSYEVEFPVLGENKSVKFTLTTDKMGVLPEGAVVITSMRNEISPEDYTIVIDMGNGTTDRAMFKGTKLVGSAITPSTFAGGTLLKLIGAEIQKTGIPTNTDLEIQALVEYKLNIKKRNIEIGSGVDNAKRIFINSYIKDEILTLIELSGIQSANVTRVIAIGGVLGSENPVTKERDLLNLIMEECNLVNADLVLIEGNQRHINIQKAADFCDILAGRLGFEVGTFPSNLEDFSKETKAKEKQEEKKKKEDITVTATEKGI